MEINFAAGVSGRVINASADKCQNFYPVVDEASKKPFALLGVPGLTEFCDTGYPMQVRGLLKFGDVLYAVVGDKVFMVSVNGVAREIPGDVLTHTGPVQMASNLTQTIFVDGRAGYIIEDRSFSKVNIPYPPIGVTFQDGYFICPVSGEDVFYISGINNGKTWGQLDYGSAEAQPDTILGVLSDHRELWMFGDKTTEVFQNTGDSDFPFERIQGAFIERGSLSGDTACKIDNSIIWLDHGGQVVRANGYTPQVVSSRNIEYQIGLLSSPGDSHAYTYTQGGHAFYVLVFDSDSKVFALDVATGQWHTRTSGLLDLRHRADCCILFGTKRICGDFENGKLYEYDFNAFDESRSIARVRVAHPERQYFIHKSLEIEFEAGIGQLTGDHADPQAVLRYSDDNGLTWSRELWRDIGKTGKYKNRARWHKLGRSIDRIYEVTLTGAYKKVIVGAVLNG